MGPKSKLQKRREALVRMIAKGPRPQGPKEAALDYGVYFHRRLEEIENLKRKLGNNA